MSNTTQPTNGEHYLGKGARALLTAAAMLVVIFGLKAAREIAVPITMAVFLATISYPITGALRRLRFPHWLAVSFTVVVDLGVIFGIYRVVKFLAAEMRAALQGNLLQLVQTKFNSATAALDQWGVGDYMRDIVGSPEKLIDPQQILALSQLLTGQVVATMSITVLVLILMTFLLGEAPLFRRNMSALQSSPKGRAEIISALRGIQRYLLIKTIASVSTGLLAWWLCHAMEIPFALLWGFVACLLNFIPTIGSIVAAVPPILLGDWGTVLIVSGGYLAINSAIGNGVEPFFLGMQFGIATSVVLLSVIFWGWVWGPFGMLLAVPLTMLTKLALEHTPDLSWVAAIINDKPTSDKNN